MCHVCKCGMHTCSTMRPSSNSHYPKDLGSEYSGRYVKWPKTLKVKPKQHSLNEDSPPFVGVTTHKVDYATKKIPPRVPVKVGGERTLDQCIPEGNYKSVTTEYGRNYKKKPFPLRSHAKQPSTNFADDAKFDDTTTHHTDYKAWPIRPRVHAEPPSTCLDSDAKLDDKTTYNLSYWDKSRVLPRPVPPKKQNTLSSDAAFYDETTHHHDFGPKPLPKRSIPVKHDTDNVGDPNHHAFDDETTYHQSFKKWPFHPHCPGGPVKCNLSPPADAKFCDDTNYKHDYKAKKLPQRCPILFRARPQKFDGDHYIYDK
ncbi:hypothetical protein KP509_06G083600 [Ceratopteris richardii]|nr:hypothetical protein KP509_06G083600 [Ceratopteris richardii]